MVDCPLPRLFFADIKEVAPSHSQTFMKLLGIHTQSKEDCYRYLWDCQIQVSTSSSCV